MRRVTVLALTLCLIVAGVAADLPTCGTTCTTNGDCVLSQDGCSVCRSGKCSQQCGAQCNKDSDCGVASGDGVAVSNSSLQCSMCYFNQCVSPTCGSACYTNSDCAPNPFCKLCTQGACSPPPTPQPSVPPTPQPPTPPPTPAPGKAAWGAFTCAGTCLLSNLFDHGTTLEEAEAVALAITPTFFGVPTVNFTWTQPTPCAAMALSGASNLTAVPYVPYFAKSTDRGTATTQAVSACRAANHSHCTVAFASCAVLPPQGARWGGFGMYPSLTLATNNGTGYSTVGEAINVTMKKCQAGVTPGLMNCSLNAVWYNCMAFAEDNGETAGIGFANSLSAAKQEALQKCSFGLQGTNDLPCAIVTAACIAPYHESNDHTVTGGRTWRFGQSGSTMVSKNGEKGLMSP